MSKKRYLYTATSNRGTGGGNGAEARYAFCGNLSGVR